MDAEVLQGHVLKGMRREPLVVFPPTRPRPRVHRLHRGRDVAGRQFLHALSRRRCSARPASASMPVGRSASSVTPESAFAASRASLPPFAGWPGQQAPGADASSPPRDCGAQRAPAGRRLVGAGDGPRPYRAAARCRLAHSASIRSCRSRCSPTRPASVAASAPRSPGRRACRAASGSNAIAFGHHVEKARGS